MLWLHGKAFLLFCNTFSHLSLQSKGMLFGVFDGHGGWACAQAVSERLLYYIAVAMMPKQSLEELEKCMEHSRPVPPILQWYKHHADFNYRDSASLYINHLRVFWQDLLDNEEHDAGMRYVKIWEFLNRRNNLSCCVLF